MAHLQQTAPSLLTHTCSLLNTAIVKLTDGRRKKPMPWLTALPGKEWNKSGGITVATAQTGL